MCTVCALHCQQKASALELELQTVRATMWVLGIEPRVPEEQLVLLITQPSLASFFPFFFEMGSYCVALDDPGTQVLLPLRHECWD